MNTGKYVFTQVTEFLPLNEFVKCVTRFRGNYQVKHFTCWHQLMCMLFGQLSNRESLSDLVTCLESQRSKWYHLGMGTGLSKSNLAYANEHCDWRIFAEYAYVIIKSLYSILEAGAYFVTRLQVNQDYRRLYSMHVDKSLGVLCDQIIKLNNFYPSKFYPDKLRRIKFYDKESELKLDFMTNNFELAALDIARLYKHRWKIELFFKWIKQHLKIKTFWGYSENAVRIQVYCAIIAYCTVAIIKEQCKIKYSTYEILQILSLTLLNKTQLNQLFDDAYLQTVKELEHKQLNMFL